MVNKNTQTDSDFLNQSQQLLEKTVDTLDSDITEKLFNVRRKVLAEHYNQRTLESEQQGWKSWLPAMGVALTASIILGVFIQSGLWQSNSLTVSDDMELAATLENIELYNDLEFYQWLVESEVQTG